MARAKAESSDPRLTRERIAELAQEFAKEKAERLAKDGVEWSEDFDAEELAEWCQAQGVPMPGLAGRTSADESFYLEELGEAFEALDPMGPLRQIGQGFYPKRWAEWLGPKGFPKLTEDELQRLAKPFIQAECAIAQAAETIRKADLDPFALARSLDTKAGHGAAQRQEATEKLAKAGTEEAKGALLFSEATKAKVAEAQRKERSKDWVEDIGKAGGLFVAWAGDLPVSKYRPEAVEDFRDNLLCKLPPWYTYRLEKDKPLGEALRELAERNTAEGGKTLGRARVNKYIAALQAILERAHCDTGNSNVAKKQQLEKDRGTRDDEERDPFTTEQLQRMVDRLAEEATEKGPYWHEWQLWVTLLALYHGSRQNEMAMLCVGDVRQVDDLWCLDVNMDDRVTTGKSIKTRGSKRLIPLHPTLVELGFLGFLERAAAGVRKPETTNLWHRTGLEKKEGKKWGYTVSKWFCYTFKRKFLSADELAQVKARELKLCFHSLRHSFISRAKWENDMETEARHAITGQSGGKSSGEAPRYEGRGGYAKLLVELSKLDYGLDLSAVSGLS